MSLETIVNTFSDLVSLKRPASIIGSAELTTTETLALAQQTGEELMRRVEWSNLYQEQTIIAAQSSATLPSDFHRLIAGGAVMEDTATPTFIRGVSSNQWRIIKRTASTQPYYFIKGGSIEFYPNTTSNGAVMSYISKNWVNPVTGSDVAVFAASDDLIHFPETLFIKGMVWRWRRGQGNEYQDHLAEFEADLVTEIKADKGLTT